MNTVKQELAEATARVDRHGMFNCPHTGVALAALFKMVDDGRIGRGERVAVVSTAHGLKFTEFKAAYHEGRLEQSQYGHRNRPIDLPAQAGVVREKLNELLQS